MFRIVRLLWNSTIWGVLHSSLGQKESRGCTVGTPWPSFAFLFSTQFTFRCMSIQNKSWKRELKWNKVTSSFMRRVRVWQALFATFWQIHFGWLGYECNQRYLIMLVWKTSAQSMVLVCSACSESWETSRDKKASLPFTKAYGHRWSAWSTQ